jgi:hypothetical protein
MVTRCPGRKSPRRMRSWMARYASRYEPRSPDGEDGIAQSLDPAEQEEVAAAGPQDSVDVLEVPVGLLDAHHVVAVPPQPAQGLHLEVHRGTAGDVVHDHRQARAARHSPEVLVQPLLGGPDVVGHQDQQRVGSCPLRELRHLHRLPVVVGPHPGHHGHAARYRLHRHLDDPPALLHGQGRGFAGGPAHGDAVAARSDLPLDQPPQGLLVHLPVPERGHERHQGAAQPAKVHFFPLLSRAAPAAAGLPTAGTPPGSGVCARGRSAPPPPGKRPAPPGPEAGRARPRTAAPGGG